jgi:hypothetical protein
MVGVCRRVDLGEGAVRSLELGDRGPPDLICGLRPLGELAQRPGRGLDGAPEFWLQQDLGLLAVASFDQPAGVLVVGLQAFTVVPSDPFRQVGIGGRGEPGKRDRKLDDRPSDCLGSEPSVAQSTGR